MLSPLRVEHSQHTVTFYQSQLWRAAVCKSGGFTSGRPKDQSGGRFAAQPETTSAVSGRLLTAKRLEKHHLQMQLGASRWRKSTGVFLQGWVTRSALGITEQQREDDRR
jgi:hypothetical protein